MARRRKAGLIRGHAAHRRTEADYMGVLLDAVTLDDWRTVVNNAKTLAQAGDARARAWLAQYLMGKAVGGAPTPLTVVVQQLNGADPVVARLAAPAIQRHKYPGLGGNDDFEEGIRALIAVELAHKVQPAETIENPATARVGGQSAAE